ncbi:MAG TPA: acyl-CoA dehydrogenase [Jiangellaceae bacterium]|nr:acyl-CoA dehydrogenase [Jiangellaceae bacterium]
MSDQALLDDGTPPEPTRAAPPVPPVSLDALTTYLDGEQAAVRSRARRFLQRNDAAAVVDLDTPAYRQQVLHWVRALAEDGVLSVSIPATYGGEDNLDGTVAAFETLAHGDLSLLIKAGVQFGLFGSAILHLGTQRHHDAYLADAISMRLPGCFAMTERGRGSDVADLRTTATYEPETDELVVHTPDRDADFKDWIGNAAQHGQLAATFAQLVVDGTSHGVHCVLVPIRNADGTVRPGVTIADCGPKGGLNGVDNGRIWFDQVRVPRTALLNRFGDVDDDGVYRSPIESDNRRFFTMLGTLVQGRVCIAAGAVGAAKSALTIAVRHATRRTQFSDSDGSGVVLLDYTQHRRRLLPRLATTYAVHAAQTELTTMFGETFRNHDDPDARRRLEAAAAGLKATATWHATDVVQAAREACGGLGYGAENRLTGLKADTDVFTTFEGDNTVLMQQVAKAMLSGFAQEFESFDLRDTAAYLASTAIEAFSEATSMRTIAQRLTDALPGRGPGQGEAVLRSRDYQLAMLEWREAHILSSLARRMRRRTSGGGDPFAAMLDVQPHMLSAAHARMDRVVAEAFVTSVNAAPERLRPVLDRLCELHLLTVLYRERGWFQEHQRMSAERAKALTMVIDQVCAEIAPHANVLVDAFAIPDDVLAAPIAVG